MVGKSALTKTDEHPVAIPTTGTTRRRCRWPNRVYGKTNATAAKAFSFLPSRRIKPPSIPRKRPPQIPNPTRSAEEEGRILQRLAGPESQPPPGSKETSRRLAPPPARCHELHLRQEEDPSRYPSPPLLLVLACGSFDSSHSPILPSSRWAAPGEIGRLCGRS